ncbi:hypothetical protein O9993_04805 [Vibrio lentus]|nr:hypothetical protein [Vibrio lentus]
MTMLNALPVISEPYLCHSYIQAIFSKKQVTHIKQWSSPLLSPQKQYWFLTDSIYKKEGIFNHEANSYLFLSKNGKNRTRPITLRSSSTRLLSICEDNDLAWDKFPPVKRLKPARFSLSY